MLAILARSSLSDPQHKLDVPEDVSDGTCSVSALSEYEIVFETA